MKIITTPIPGVLIIEPRVFGDARGYFLESFQQERYAEAGIDAEFIQDNESFSSYGVVRGLHYQSAPYTQGKLVRAISGTVLDVTVDIRPGSPTFGRHVAVELSGANKRQLWLPRGMAHGFAVLSENALFAYKCDNAYMPTHERTIRFDDPALQIDWRIPKEFMLLSAKDQNAVLLADAEPLELPL